MINQRIFPDSKGLRLFNKRFIIDSDISEFYYNLLQYIGLKQREFKFHPA